MNVRDCMTSDVFTVRLDKRVLIAAEIMKWAHVRHVPVVDGRGALMGMISHRDVLRVSMSSLEEPEVEQRNKLGQVPIHAVMTMDVQTIGPDASIQQAARLLREGRFGCLPVIEDGQLVGVLTEHDLLRVIEGMDSLLTR